MAFSNASLTGCNCVSTFFLSSKLARSLLPAVSDTILFNSSMFSNGGIIAVTSNASFCVRLLSINITLPCCPMPVNSFITS